MEAVDQGQAPHAAQAPSARAAASELGPPRAVVLAALLVTTLNAILISALIPLKPEGGAARLLHHLYDTGQHWALALIALGVGWAVARLRLKPALASLLSSVLLGLLLCPLLGLGLWPELTPLVQRYILPWAETPATGAFVSAIVVAIVAAWHLTRLVRARWLLLGVALLALCGLAANHVVLPSDYAGVHLALSVGASTVLAAALSRLPAPARLPARLPRLAWAAVAILSTWSVATRPSNQVLIELLQSEGSSIAPVLAWVHSKRLRGVHGLGGHGPFWLSRKGALPTPPSDVPRPIAAPIVVLIVIDALRYDLIEGGKFRELLPTLSGLAKRSLYFTNARAPGTQTVYSLTTLFAGTYFSQQYWSTGTPDPETRATNFLFPHADKTVRFPQVLQQAGVRTVTRASSSWLVSSVGVVRGFDEERFVVPSQPNERYTFAAELTSAAIQRLSHDNRGPLFFFMHYLDPHAPYDRGDSKGSQFRRYVAEVSYVDHQLGRLIDALAEAGLAQRTVMIVCSDHGEAFGEHGTYTHASTLYDELLHVPLMIAAKHVKPRRIDQLVSLIDLGPTILDLFGQATPGHVLGESLLGFLSGNDPVLTRPVMAEGRLKKAWVLPNGYKLITDDVTGTVELYDLSKDPRELQNLFEKDSSANRRLAMLRGFFDAHRIRKRGYTIPLRR